MNKLLSSIFRLLGNLCHNYRIVFWNLGTHFDLKSRGLICNCKREAE